MFGGWRILGLSVTTTLAVLIFSSPVALGFLIDNEIVEDPAVDCEDTMIGLTFKTKKPFTGRIYVRGLADDDRCARNFATNTDQQKLGIMIQNGDCTMQRQRVAGTLEGLMFSITIVVSFHGTFVTKADRAYRAMCFFRNVKRLTNGIDMSQLGTTELLDTAKMPSCSYSIRSAGPDGPPVTLGQVGDKIFHVWECDETAQGYNFLVHSCWTDDGRGARFDLLDIDGCAIDPVIQPDVVYDMDTNKAYAETWGYKFSDTSVLNYQCVVELCKKATGECEGLTPPSCGRRKRRALESSTRYPESTKVNEFNVNQLDVLTSITMVDSERMSQDKIASNDPVIKEFDQMYYGGHPDKTDTVGFHKVCIAQPTFALLLSAIAFLIVSSATGFITLYYKFRTQKVIPITPKA